MVVEPVILTYPKLPFDHGRKGREGIQQTLFSPTKGKIHGVWKFNNITPLHLSRPVDTFSTLPSMAVGYKK
jgi:hypothetical protein